MDLTDQQSERVETVFKGVGRDFASGSWLGRDSRGIRASKSLDNWIVDRSLARAGDQGATKKGSGRTRRPVPAPWGQGDTQATAVLATSVRTMMKTLSAAALLSALAPQVVANDNGLGLT